MNCVGKAEDRRQVDYHDVKSILQVIDEIEKSLEVLTRPSDVGGGARYKVNPRALFDGNDIVGCASVLKKISQRETKILIEEPRGAGATQIRIDEDNLFAGQRCRAREGESMGGFPLAAGRGRYAEGGAGLASPSGSRSRARDGEGNVGPGKTNCLGAQRPVL